MLLSNCWSKDLVRSEVKTKFAVSLSSNFFAALPSRPEIYNSDASSQVRHADFAVCAVLVLGAQHSTDSVELRQLLDHHKINNQTLEQLFETYEKSKDEITLKLAKIGNSHGIPDLTNVTVEVQQELSTNELIYRVNFHSFNHAEGKSRVIQEVFCNHEELQSLINKFKDIERHCKTLSK